MRLKEMIVDWSEALRDKFHLQFGFPPRAISVYNVVDYFHTNKDASSLAVTRILFGLAMLFDIPDERGGATMDHRWGDPKTCHFPLLPFLTALPMPYMALVYTAMSLGALGIMLGYKYPLSAAVFAASYWYLFLVEKSFWNNHSYLFGLVALLLLPTRANCCWSLDARFDPRVRSRNVPYWNYFILKYQFFILYFMAGIKKGTAEWLTGYSLPNLSEHWVFAPFRLFLSVEQTDHLVVHWFAFFFDLTVAFWMMWSKTRHVAMVFCAAFHLMNIRLFRIGMFPWVCLATMPLFYPFDWPKQLWKCLVAAKHKLKQVFFNLDEPNCDEGYYPEEIEYDDNSELTEEEIFQQYERHPYIENLHVKQPELTAEEEREIDDFLDDSYWPHFRVFLIIVYMVLQAFLPFSHFIIKGYNNWTPGLYGYSWDMMVHTWDVNSVVVKVVDHDLGTEFFVDPYALTPNDRWTRHGDMVWQFARCLKQNLKNDEADKPKNISVYVDVWCSLNGRFHQRMFNPKVDLLKAPWSPFEDVQWLMPLLSEADTWRSILDDLRANVHSWNNFSDVIFVADFPGYDLENFLAPELTNVTLTVLDGIVGYEPEVKLSSVGQSFIRKTGDVTSVPAGRFHRVINIGTQPAYYMYTFLNKTEAARVGKPQDKPLLPLRSEFARRMKDAFTFFDSVHIFLFKIFFRMPVQHLATYLVN